MSRKSLALTLLLSVFALLGVGVALAQSYPPPVGSLTAVSGTTITDPGGSVPLSATVRDGQGNPVEGADVTFTIVDQPGSDANLAGSLSKTVQSAANGVATVTLFTGSTPGRIVVEVMSGEKTAQLLVEVRGVQRGPAEAPETGSPPPPDEGGPPGWLIAALVGAGLLAVGGGLTLLGRRRA